MYNKRLIIDLTLSESSTYVYVNEVKKELYGKPKKERGSLGQCHYELAKKNPNNGYPIPFTDEEKAIRNELIKKHFFDGKEEALVIVQSMIESGELDEKDAWSTYSEMTNPKVAYSSFMKELEEILQCKIVRATRIEKLGF